MANTFLKICEREIIDKVNDGLSLRVIMDKGVSSTPDVDIKVTHLNKDGWKGYPHFQYNGYFGDSFKVDVIFKGDDYYNNGKGNRKVINYVHNIYTQGKKIYVVSRAVDITNGWYMITDVDKKQTFEKESVWTIEFTYFRSLEVIRYKNNNMSIAQAKANAKKKNKSSKSINKALSKCKVSEMKLKKKNMCCYRLNAKLLKLGYLSSKTWKTMTKKKQTQTFTKDTAKALKKFQAKYKVRDKNLSHHLIVSGKMDSKTLKALCKS